MNEEMQNKIELYKIYNESMEKFKRHNFVSNRFYIVVLFLILLIILIAKQVFISGSLLFTFTFSFFGLCVSIMWVITQDSYSHLISIKVGKVLEEIEKEFPVKPYTIEHSEIIKYKKDKKVFTFDNMQNFMAVVIAVIFTILFFSELVPFIILVKSLVS